MAAGANPMGQTLEEPLLESYPVVRAQSTDEAEHALRATYGVRSFSVPDRGSKFHLHGNYKQLRDISLAYCRYGAPVEMDFPEAHFARQLFCFSGEGGVETRTRDSVLRTESSMVLPPNLPHKARFSGGFGHLVLRINETALVEKLTALLGEQPNAPLVLQVGEPAESDVLLRDLISYFARNLHKMEQNSVSTPIIPEMEQAIVAAFLYTNRSNYSELLHAVPKAAAPWEVRAVEDYIVANWNKPIDMLHLTTITGGSARSIFRAFARTRGYSPMEFLKRVRLMQARLKLQSGDPDISVTAVGYACGFNNLGRFAHDYRALFGELPSETLAWKGSTK